MAQLAPSLISCFTSSTVFETPYPHWLLNNIFPEEIAHAIDDLVIPMGAGLDYGGKRELNNSQRAFFDAQRQAENPAVAAVAQAFKAPETIACIEELTKTDLTGSLLRLEYTQDSDGFWLEPHTDIGAKLFTMLWYLSVGEGSDNCGTDVLDGDFNLVRQAPFTFNTGLIFIPGENTWHSFHKRKIVGVRKSVIINFVKPEWRSRHELAFQDPVK